MNTTQARKKMTETWTAYSYSHGKPDLQRELAKIVYKYNEDGNEIEYVLLNGSYMNSDILFATERKLSYFQGMKKTEDITFDKDEKITERNFYKYNSNNQLVETLLYKNGLVLKENLWIDELMPRSKYQFLYTDNGLLKESRKLSYVGIIEKINGKYIDRQSPDPELRYVTTYRYNNSNRLIEKIEKHDEGRLKSKFLYSYDSNGNCIEVIEYDHKGRVDEKTIKIYGQNKLIKEQIEDDYEKEENSFRYDEAGNVIEKLKTTYDLSGNLKNQTCWKISYEYY